jgi:hypothetical protein
VSIDQHLRGTFDQYDSAWHVRVPRSFRHLGPGEHTITIRVLGAKGSSAGTDTQVAVDAFGVGSRVVSNPELTLSWGRSKLRAASRGSVATSDLARSEADFAFWGTGVEWATVRGPDQGRASIFVDGVLAMTVDNYAAATSVEPRSFAGLDLGDHELHIVVLGNSRPRSEGTNVGIDTFTVLP